MMSFHYVDIKLMFTIRIIIIIISEVGLYVL